MSRAVISIPCFSSALRANVTELEQIDIIDNQFAYLLE